MTGEVVNLRRARKQRGRQEAEAAAAENRLRFGRSRAERELADHQEARAARHLDGHLLRGAGEREEPV